MGHDGRVLQARVQFDLVGGDVVRAHGLNRLLLQRHREVGNADRPGQAQFPGLHQRVQRLRQRHGRGRRRPVDQRQVHLPGAQLGQAFAQAGQQLRRPQVLGPDLGGQEQLLTRHAAVGNGLADLGLVAIDLRRIDGAKADFQRIAHGVDHGVAGEAESAQAQIGDVEGSRHGSSVEK
ncbi:hypothetical protein D3C80_1534940 [compost metagenome]